MKLTGQRGATEGRSAGHSEKEEGASPLELGCVPHSPTEEEVMHLRKLEARSNLLSRAV